MIVLDASVVVKWFLREPGHEEAIEIVRSREAIAAPDLVIPEVMNVLRRKERQGLVNPEQLMSAAETISDAFVRLVPARELVGVAISLSRALDHSVYGLLLFSLCRHKRVHAHNGRRGVRCKSDR